MNEWMNERETRARTSMNFFFKETFFINIQTGVVGFFFCIGQETLSFFYSESIVVCIIITIIIMMKTITIDWLIDRSIESINRFNSCNKMKVKNTYPMFFFEMKAAKYNLSNRIFDGRIYSYRINKHTHVI